MGERNTASSCSSPRSLLRSRWASMACHCARAAATEGCSLGSSAFMTFSCSGWCQCRFTVKSQRSGDFGALLDGALGVELGGHVSTTNQGHLLACGFQARLQFAEGFLTSTQHHIVNGQNHVLATHRDVQARGVDLVGADTGNHFTIAVLQRGAVDPAGGLAQAVADLAGLALQQVDLTGSLLQMRLLEATPVGVVAVNAPLVVELGQIQCGAVPLVRQVL